MKLHAFILAAAMAAAPLGTLAQDQPAQPPASASMPGRPHLTPAQRDQVRSTIQAMMKQAGSIRRQARTQMLGAITPAHRALLAQVVGQLAVSASPDPRAAADQLNAALSPAERQSILSAAANERTQMMALRKDTRAKMQAIVPMPSHAPRNEQGAREHKRHTPNAGAILLMMARGGGHAPMMMGGRGMGRGPGR